MAVITEQLSLINEQRVKAELAKGGLDCHVYWWNMDEVELDGDFSIKDLKRLVALMESFVDEQPEEEC
uniref:Uncharacterized protein n=1 Tax=viral metagenome TaxID=1070528 RepID=A0A6M3KRI1_9ZZZZ